MINKPTVPATLDYGSTEPLGVSTLLEVLLRHIGKATAVLIGVTGLVVWWEFGRPARFASEMVLLVQNARSKEVITSSQAGNAPPSNEVTEQQINTEVAALNSDDLLDEIVRPGWSEHARESLSTSEMLEHQKAARDLRQRLDISPIRGSHAISIKSTGASPSEARDTLRKLLDVFLKQKMALAHVAGASSVFSQQAADYGRRLEVARKNLAGFQNRNGFASLPSREQSLEVKLLDLQTALREVDVQIRDMSNRISMGQQQLDATPRRLSTTERSAPANGTVDQLNYLLVVLRNKRTELLTKYRDDDRLVAEVDQQIADTVSALNKASTVGVHEVATDVNPLWESAQREVNNTTVVLTGLRARRIGLQLQVSAVQSELGKVEKMAAPYFALDQQVTELESEYRNFVQMRDSALASDLMDKQQWLNIAVIQNPTLAMIPSHPRPRTDLPLGVATALLLAGCTIVLSEMLRDTVATSAEVASMSAYPVLGSMSLVKSLNSGEHSAVRQPRPINPGVRVGSLPDTPTKTFNT